MSAQKAIIGLVTGAMSVLMLIAHLSTLMSHGLQRSTLFVEMVVLIVKMKKLVKNAEEVGTNITRDVEWNVQVVLNLYQAQMNVWDVML